MEQGSGSSSTPATPYASEVAKKQTVNLLSLLNNCGNLGVKRGVLYFEILIVLFILSVVALPWISYLNRHDPTIVIADLNDFFQLKRILLQQLEKGGRDYEYKYANRRIVVFKTYINEKCNKLTADLYEKDNLKYSLFAIIK